MDFANSFQISRSAMAIEKLRMDVAAANLANLQTSAPDVASVYKPLAVLGRATPASFEQMFGTFNVRFKGGVDIEAVAATEVTPRRVQQPGHPHADATGFVTYPGIDHAGEMLGMMRALRSYEANVAALNMARTMAQRALDIGGQQ